MSVMKLCSKLHDAMVYTGPVCSACFYIDQLRKENARILLEKDDLEKVIEKLEAKILELEPLQQNRM